ncbi:MAG: hypothetical protein CMH64_01355 [Nanoarchaeota archaeon]|nr:hypothetical protein [Nanoarchaeota archaeon]
MEKKNNLIDVILILFGLFIAYQLLRIILGGSWQTESVILAFLIFNLGLTWKINSGFGKLNAKLEGHLGWHKGKDSK